MWGGIKRLFGKGRPSTPKRLPSFTLPNIFRRKPRTRRRSSSPKESASNNNPLMSNSVAASTVTNHDGTNVDVNEQTERSFQAHAAEESPSNYGDNRLVDDVPPDLQTEDEQFDIPTSNDFPDSGSEEQTNDQNNLAASQTDPAASHSHSSSTESLIYLRTTEACIKPGSTGRLVQAEGDPVFKGTSSNMLFGQWNGGGYQGHSRGKNVRPD